MALQVGGVRSASAQTSPSQQLQIQQLLQQILQLQTQINSLQSQRQTAVSETAQLLRTLKKGDAGDDVRTLQLLLAADPTVYPEGIISGRYGLLTVAAVRRYQRNHDLNQVGAVGQLTLKKLRLSK